MISFPGVVNSTAGSNESGCVPSSTASVFDPELEEEDELEETVLVVELVVICVDEVEVDDVEEELVLVVELFPIEVAK